MVFTPRFVAQTLALGLFAVTLFSCRSSTGSQTAADTPPRDSSVFTSLIAASNYNEAILWLSVLPSMAPKTICTVPTDTNTCLPLTMMGSRNGRDFYKAAKPIALLAGTLTLNITGQPAHHLKLHSTESVAPSSFAPKFDTLAQQRDEKRAAALPILTDIVTHIPTSGGDQYFDADKITWGHEGTHAVNAEIRNKLNRTGVRSNGFYVLNDRAVLVTEPSFRKGQVAGYVPATLRNLDITARFNTYITGQTEWDDTPLYIFDEWNAYVNGAAVAQDMIDHGQSPRADGLMGGAEFTVYAWSLAYAAEKLDSKAAADPQLKAFIGFNSLRYASYVKNSLGKQDLSGSQIRNYFRKLDTDSAAKPLKDFVLRYLGESFYNDFQKSIQGS